MLPAGCRWPGFISSRSPTYRPQGKTGRRRLPTTQVCNAEISHEGEHAALVRLTVLLVSGRSCGGLFNIHTRALSAPL